MLKDHFSQFCVPYKFEMGANVKKVTVPFPRADEERHCLGQS
jgi:hypothetical protein